MPNFSSLIADVSEVIKDNDNQEITGDVLQNVLTSIISNIGGNAQYAGIAVPSTNPGLADANVFYLAISPGLYANFGGLRVTQLTILLNNSGVWQKQPLGIMFSDPYPFKSQNDSQKFKDVQDSILQIQLLDGFDKTKNYGLKDLVYKAGISYINGLYLTIADLTANTNFSVIVFTFANASFTVSTDKSNVYEWTSGAYKIRIKFNVDKMLAAIDAGAVNAEFSALTFSNTVFQSGEVASILGLSSRMTTAETNITTLQNETRNTLNDVNNLAYYGSGSGVGKSYTIASGATGLNSVIGLTIPAGYPNKKLKLQYTCNKNLGSNLYWQQNGGGGPALMPAKIVSWASDGLGGFVYNIDVEASSTTLVSVLYLLVTNNVALVGTTTITLTKVEYVETLQTWSLVAKSQLATLVPDVNTLKSDVSTLKTDVNTVTEILKERDVQLTPYANRTAIVILEGANTAQTLQFNVPTNLFDVGEKMNFQWTSANGNNPGRTTIYKIVGGVTTGIVVLTWTLNVSDGKYYSQIVSITPTQAELSNNATFIVFLQAYNASGLNADTITTVQSYLDNTTWIDVKGINDKIANIPANLNAALEIPWRGYGSMIPVKVKKDGTGDFTTIQAAINSINDASISKQYDVQVFDDFDVTDLTTLWRVATPTVANNQTADITQALALIITKNWVHVRGIGKQKRLRLLSPTTLTASSYQYLQLIYPQGNVIINNFDLVLRGGRYCVHQESGGSNLSQDYKASTIMLNTSRTHLGNATSDGYPVGAWASYVPEADGTAGGLKKWDIGGKYIAASDVPLFIHSNRDFDEPNELHFINCEMSRNRNFNLSTFRPEFQDLGSGKRNLVEIIGCNFPKFVITNIISSRELTMTMADFYMNGGAELRGYGNAPMLLNEEAPTTLYFKAVTAGHDIVVTGGSAYAAIFGSDLRNIKGSIDLGGEVWGAKRIENPSPSQGQSQIFSLPYRLGNCADTPKTLVLQVNGVEYTITFDQNYMTSNGSVYAWNTVPNISEATILASINAVAPSVFQCTTKQLLGLYTFMDCFENGTNASSATLQIGKGVVRDYANGFNTWKLSQAGEKAEGIVGERINPGVGANFDLGKIILIEKALYRGAIMGLTGMTPGTFYKCAADGTFVSTINRDEAVLVSTDSNNLRPL